MTDRIDKPYVEYTQDIPSAASQVVARIAEEKTRLSSEMTVEQYRESQRLLSEARVIPINVECTPAVYHNVPCEWVYRRLLKPDFKKIIIYFHGGSWMFGGLESARPVAVMLTKLTNIPVLMVDYRLAPEHTYPAGFMDCHSVYIHMMRLRFRSSRIGIFGDSAGGNLTLALLNRLKEEGESLPACVGLASPVTDMRSESAIVQSNDPLIYVQHNEKRQDIFSVYLGDEYIVQRNLPTISPITADLSGLPPMLIHSGELEPISADNVAYAKKVYESGGKAFVKVWKDMFHDFTIVGKTLKESVRSMEEMAEFFKENIV